MEQQFIDYIKKQYDSHLEWFSRNRNQSINIDSSLALLKTWEEILLGNVPLNDNILIQLANRDYYIICEFIERVLLSNGRNGQPDPKDNPFTMAHPIIRQMIHKQYSTQPYPLGGLVNRYVYRKILYNTDKELDELLQFLYQQKFTDQDICNIGFENSTCSLFDRRFSSKRNNSETPVLSRFGEFILNKTKEQKSFLGIFKNSDFKQAIDDKILKQNNNNSDQKNEWLRFLLQYLPDSVNHSNVSEFFTTKDHQEQRVVNVESFFILIENNAKQFEQELVRAINDFPFQQETRYSLYVELNNKCEGKYHQNLVAIGETYLQTEFNKSTSTQRYRHDLSTRKGYLSIEYVKYLLQQNPIEGRKRIEQYLRDSDYIYTHF